MLIIGIIALLLIAITLTNEIPENMKLLLVVVALGIGFLYVVSNATAGLGRTMGGWS